MKNNQHNQIQNITLRNMYLFIPPYIEAVRLLLTVSCRKIGEQDEHQTLGLVALLIQ